MICGVEGHILDHHFLLRKERVPATDLLTLYSDRKMNNSCDKVQKSSRLGIEWVSSSIKSHLFLDSVEDAQPVSGPAVLVRVQVGELVICDCGRTHRQKLE